jgi:sugar fermentation stimulation protein A
MEELLVPGTTEARIVPAAPQKHRKTRFDLVAVRHGRAWVSVDARVANHLVAAALEGDVLPSFRGSFPWRPEVSVGNHRFDFGRFRSDGRLLSVLEVKSSNLKIGTTALFPDAPTLRGRRHLFELARLARGGVDASMLFLIQRTDVRQFAPNRALDPGFAAAFDVARHSGVRLFAQTSRVTRSGIQWGQAVPICETLGGERIL